jgi:WD domain, G-beta repeat
MVIQGPCELAGIDISEELVARLVDDTGTGEALPLLAFTLEQLADGVGRGGRLSARRYDQQIGGVQGALVRHADAVLADACATSGRSPAKVVEGLTRLVTIDELGHRTGSRVDYYEELSEPMRAELDVYVDRRLVVRDKEPNNGRVVVRVAHEKFLTAWPPLAEAITARESALRMRRMVEHAAADWYRQDRPTSRLWERGQLASAVNDTGARIRRVSRSGNQPPEATPSLPQQLPFRWLPGGKGELDTDKVSLNPVARTFLHSSILVDRWRRRRTNIILSALLVLAIAAFVIADRQRDAAQLQQQIATAHGLVAQAEAARDRDPRSALLLGIAAHRIHSDGETEASLVNTLFATPYAGTLAGHTDGVRSVAFAPDGRTLATASDDDTVILWDLSDPTHRRLGQPLTGHTEGVSSVAFTPDGRTLATASDDHTVILWDLATLDELRRGVVQRACSRTGQGLDRDEWTRYISTLPYQNTCPA